MSDKPNRIQTVTAFWNTPYSEKVWKRLETFKVDYKSLPPESQGLDLLVLGMALPDGPDSRVARATVYRDLNAGRKGGDPDTNLHWTLTIRQAPSGEPPAILKDEDVKVGGKSGLGDILYKCFPDDIAPLGKFIIDMRLDGSAYKCIVVPIELKHEARNEPALNLASRITLEQVGYRFDSGVNGLAEIAIIYDHVGDSFLVTIRASGPVTLTTDTWLPYANEVADLVATTFFVAGERGE